MEPESIKVVLLGEAGVGKTCIIKQFTEKKFDVNTMSSLSAQFVSKTIDYEGYGAIKYDIWDTAEPDAHCQSNPFDLDKSDCLEIRGDSRPKVKDGLTIFKNGIPEQELRKLYELPFWEIVIESDEKIAMSMGATHYIVDGKGFVQR